MALGHVSAQPTTDQCTRDEGCNRQVALIEQGLAMLQTMDGRLESMDGRLESMDGRLESMDGRLD